MANAFTPTRAWRYGGNEGKTLLRVEGSLVIDTTALGGATAGDLPASMFGLTEIIGVSVAILSTNAKNYFGSPSYDASSVMIGGGAANVAMDLPNGTYKFLIEGYAA